jgi:L-phenylalanine/L-methionine N-acetyltransferase
MSSQDIANIVVRRAEPEDYRGLQRIHALPRAVWGTLQVPYPSVQTWRKRLEKQSSNHYGLVACVQHELVGSLGLVVAERSPRRWHAAEIGMAVADEWQGRGIGSALLKAALDLADRWLSLRRVELTVYADNAVAIHLYRKFGFEVEGLLRGYSFRDGAFVDSYAMARLR